MRTTFAVLAALGVVSLACGCDEEKKPTETAPSATAAAPTASAATAATPPPKASPAEVISKSLKASVAAWNAHDAAKVGAGYEPGAKLALVGVQDVSGRDAIVAEAKTDFAAYSDFKVAVTRTFVKGNTCVLEWVITGKNDGPWQGQKASGRQMGIAGASVATYDDDGLIKEERRYFDLPTIQSQLDPKAKAGTFRAPMTLPTGATEEHVAKGTPDEGKTNEQGLAIAKAYDSKDDKQYLATATDDYVWEDYSQPATVKKADLKATMAGFYKAFPDGMLPISMSMGIDGYFVFEGAFTGTQKGALGPIKASNKPVKMRLVDIQLLKDGKATKEWSYANNAEMLVQIGAMPPIATAPAASGSAVAAAAPTAPAKPK
jgi:predicted ester cyclase